MGEDALGKGRSISMITWQERQRRGQREKEQRWTYTTHGTSPQQTPFLDRLHNRFFENQ